MHGCKLWWKLTLCSQSFHTTSKVDCLFDLGSGVISHAIEDGERSCSVMDLYAGENSGFTFEKAWRQCGGEEKFLLEVDLKRGPQHDMLPDDGLYAALVLAALQGKLLGVLGGPNCRSRSVLRHYDIPGCDTAPRPVRAWGGEEYGKEFGGGRDGQRG